MALLDGVKDKRNHPVPEGKEFIINSPHLPMSERTLHTLDELSEAINLIDPETFHTHVNQEKNDFAAWVEHVFGEQELAEHLRKFPTPLRMMVSIEKFLRNAEAPLAPSAPATTKSRTIPVQTDPQQPAA